MLKRRINRPRSFSASVRSTRVRSRETEIKEKSVTSVRRISDIITGLKMLIADFQIRRLQNLGTLDFTSHYRYKITF